MREWANAQGCTEAAWEFQRFKDHHTAKATHFTDWMAAWRNWIRKAIEMKEQRHA